MTPTTITSRSGDDGVLSVVLPLGPAEANREFRITVEPVLPRTSKSGEEWSAWVDSHAGKWQGEFERMPQGDYEEREPLP
jgi:hypothetical protein